MQDDEFDDKPCKIIIMYSRQLCKISHILLSIDRTLFFIR